MNELKVYIVHLQVHIGTRIKKTCNIEQREFSSRHQLNIEKEEKIDRERGKKHKFYETKTPLIIVQSLHCYILSENEK